MNFQEYADALIAADEPASMLPPATRKPRVPYVPKARPKKQPEPGLLSKAGSALGTALGAAKERVDIATNYYSNPTLRDRVLSGADPVPSEVLAKEALIGPPEEGMSTGEKYTRSVGRGLVEGGTRILTDPLAMTLMAARVPGIAGKAMHLGFMGMMAHGMYEGGKSAYQAYRTQGFTPNVAEELAKMGVDAGLLTWPLLAKTLGRRAVQPSPTVGGLGSRPVEPSATTPPPEETGFYIHPELIAERTARERGFAMAPEYPGRGGGSAVVRRGEAGIVPPEPPPSDIVPATIEARLLRPPMPPLPPGSGPALPPPGRPSPANVARVPEEINIRAHASVVDEIDNRLRLAIAEGDNLTATQLIKLREGIRESAWQSQPGSAASLRQPYVKPEVSIEVVSQPQNRPRMLQVRSGLVELLAQEQNPLQRAKLRTAVASLDAQLRQNPMPVLPAPTMPRALPPGEPQPPAGAPAPVPPPPVAPVAPAGAEAAGPPSVPAPPPGIAPQTELAPSGPTLAGEGMGPTGAAPALPPGASTGERTAALVQAARERGAGAAETGAAVPPPVATGPTRELAARADQGPIPVPAGLPTPAGPTMPTTAREVPGGATDFGRGGGSDIGPLHAAGSPTGQGAGGGGGAQPEAAGAVRPPQERVRGPRTAGVAGPGEEPPLPPKQLFHAGPAKLEGGKLSPSRQGRTHVYGVNATDNVKLARVFERKIEGEAATHALSMNVENPFSLDKTYAPEDLPPALRDRFPEGGQGQEIHSELLRAERKRISGERELDEDALKLSIKNVSDDLRALGFDSYHFRYKVPGGPEGNVWAAWDDAQIKMRRAKVPAQEVSPFERRAGVLEQAETEALQAAFDAPRGRVTSAMLVEAGFDKKAAIRTLRLMEENGLVEFNRRGAEYRLTEEGRKRAAEVAAPEPAPPTEPPVEPGAPRDWDMGGSDEAFIARNRYVTGNTQAEAEAAARAFEPERAAFDADLGGRNAEISVYRVGEFDPAKFQSYSLNPDRLGYFKNRRQQAPVEYRVKVGDIAFPGSHSDLEVVVHSSKVRSRAAEVVAAPVEAAPPVPESEPPPAEAAAAEPTTARELRPIETVKPKAMTARQLKATRNRIASGEAAGAEWYSDGNMLIAGKAPKAANVEPIETASLEKFIDRARAADKKATVRGVESGGGEQDMVWLAGQGVPDVAIGARYYAHVLRAAGKSPVTWFIERKQPAVAYRGDVQSPGKTPLAVVQPIKTGSRRAPEVDVRDATAAHEAAIEAAKDSAGRVQWKKVPEPPRDAEGNPILPGQEDWTPERRAQARAAAEAVVGEVAESERMQPTGRMPILDETGKVDYNTVGQGGDMAGWVANSSAKRGTPLEGIDASPKEMADALKKDKGNPLEREILEKVDESTRDTNFRRGEVLVKDALETYKGNALRAWDSFERQVEAARAKNEQVDPAIPEAIQSLRETAAREMGLEAVPKGGPELEAFEQGARVRMAEARADILKRSRERGAVSLDLLLAPYHVVRDAVVLGTRALRAGFTSFDRWASEMGRQLGAGWKGLRDLFRWVTGSQAKAAPAAPAPPAPPFEPPASAVAPSAPRPRKTGIGMREDVTVPSPEETARVPKFEGPLRPGEKPKATDYPVNVERLTTDADMRSEQHRMAEALKGTLNENRTYRGWEEARKQAVASGLDKAAFERLVRERGAVTDAEMEAGRILREQAAEDFVGKRKVAEAMKQSTTVSPQELAAAEEEMLAAAARWGSITSHTTAAGGETGRALAILRKFSESLTPEERLYQQAVKFGMKKAVDPALMNKLAEAVLAKDHAKLTELGRDIMKPTMLDKVNEFFINNILSSIPTPAANVLGNAGHELLMRTPERYIAGLIEKGRAGAEGRAPERLPEEAFEAFKANWKHGLGFTKDSVHEIVRRTIHENPWDPEGAGLKGEFRPPALGGTLGKVWRTPSRLLRSLDMAARSSAYEAQLAAEVYREGFNTGRAKGLEGPPLKEHMEQHSAALLKDLQTWREVDVLRSINGEKSLSDSQKNTYYNARLNRIGKAAEDAARESTFQDLPGAFTRAALRLRGTHPWLTLFVPFISTPSRILSQALARTPFGLARAVSRTAKGEIKGGASADELAKGIWGTMISAGLYGMAESGILTGSGPTDPKERAAWQKTGKEPYSVRIGDEWVSMARLEPLATILGLSADLSEAKNAKKAGDLADKLVATATNNIMSKSYLEGISGMIEAVHDPERFGSAYVKKFAGALAVPNLVAAAARATDPYVRETGGDEDMPSAARLILPTIASRIPGVSRLLPAKLEGTGEPLARTETPLSRFASPVRYRHEAGKEADLERLMLDVGYFPSRPPKTITVPGTGGMKAELHQKEREVYAAAMRVATSRARRLASDPRFKRLDPLRQEKMLKDLYRDARDSANERVAPVVARRAAMERS